MSKNCDTNKKVKTVVFETQVCVHELNAKKLESTLKKTAELFFPEDDPYVHHHEEYNKYGYVTLSIRGVVSWRIYPRVTRVLHDFLEMWADGNGIKVSLETNIQYKTPEGYEHEIDNDDTLQ